MGSDKHKATARELRKAIYVALASPTGADARVIAAATGYTVKHVQTAIMREMVKRKQENRQRRVLDKGQDTYTVPRTQRPAVLTSANPHNVLYAEHLCHKVLYWGCPFCYRAAHNRWPSWYTPPAP